MRHFDIEIHDSPTMKDGPISEQELMQQEKDLDFNTMIEKHGDQQFNAEERMASLRIEDIKQQNEELAAEAQRAAEERAQLSRENAYLQGRLDVVQTAQHSSLPPELEFDPDELALHGDAKDFVSKVAKREVLTDREALRNEIRGEFQEEIEALRAMTEAVAVDQKATQAMTVESSARRFKSELRNGVSDLGMDIDALSSDEHFASYCNQRFAIGSSMTWGTVLKDNIDNQEYQDCIDMFQQYAQARGLSPQARADNLMVPAGTGSRQTSASPQMASGLSPEAKLLGEIEGMQDDFLQGRYKGSRDDYLSEKQDKLDKLEDILAKK